MNKDLDLTLIKKPIQRSKMREIDRLSNLPDHLIHSILSFLDTKSAVQSCILSKHWRHHWKSAQTLNFHHITFKYKRDFGKFVRQVLRRRRPFKLSKLRFYSGRRKNSSLIKRIFNYAKLHGVEELETDVTNFPPSFLNCPTLKTLRLGPGGTIRDVPNPFAFASLTTLQLSYVWFCFEQDDYDFFSRFLNLRNLTIIGCYLINFNIFNISAPRLLNLTISNLQCHPPDPMIVISAPILKFVRFHGTFPLELLNMDNCPALDKVDINCLVYWQYFSVERINDFDFISYLIFIAQRLSHAKSCTISLDLIDQARFILHRYSPYLPIEILLSLDQEKWLIYECINPSVLQLYGLNGPL